MKFFLEFKFLGLREHCLFRPGSIIGHQQDWLQDKQEEMWQQVQIQYTAVQDTVRQDKLGQDIGFDIYMDQNIKEGGKLILLEKHRGKHNVVKQKTTVRLKLHI